MRHAVYPFSSIIILLYLSAKTETNSHFNASILIEVVVVSDFLCIDFLFVDGFPGIEDIRQHEGNEKTHIRHCTKRKLTAATVGYGKAALQVGVRGIIGGIVPSRTKQQTEHHEHHTNACRPDAAHISLALDGAYHGIEQEHYAQEQYYKQVPHFQEVVQVFHGFHGDDACCRVISIPVFEQRPYKESQEENQEGNYCSHQFHRCPAPDILVVYIIHNIQRAQHSCKEEDGQSERQVPGVEQSIKSVRRVGPS